MKKKLIVNTNKELREIEQMLVDLDDNVQRHRNRADALTSANDIKNLIVGIAEVGHKQSTSLREILQLLRDFINVDEAVLELWKKKTELYDVYVQNTEAALRAVQKDGAAYALIKANVQLAEHQRSVGKRQYKMREDVAQVNVVMMIAAAKLAVFNTLIVISSDNAQYASKKGKAILELAKNAVSLHPVAGTLIGFADLLKSFIKFAELNMEQKRGYDRELIAMDESVANYCKQYREQLTLLKDSGQRYESLKNAMESVIAEMQREHVEVREQIAETEKILRPGATL